MKPQLKPKRNNEEDSALFSLIEPFAVSMQPINTAYVSSVNKEFVDVAQFEELVYTLDSAKIGDVVEIKLSSVGGQLHSILPLIQAMRTTQAYVFVHAVSDVASAATFLLMEADDVFVNPYVTLMCHQVSFGAAGTGSSVEANVSHTLKSAKEIIHDMYADFFTEAEIQQMNSGKDFYMDKAEFDKRYAKRNQIREARKEREKNGIVTTEPSKKQRTARKKKEETVAN